MKKAIEGESPTKKKLNVLLYLWQMNWMIMEFIVNKWIMKIHIISKEYKSQHMKIKSHTSTKKSKVEIHEWISKCQEKHVLEGIESLNEFIVNNTIPLCISHNNLSYSREYIW
jgi:hypothetical protein